MAQTKYTSLSTFIKGVMAVNEPALSDGERLILFALLSCVDYKTGCSHPGNTKLMEAANRSFRSVQRLLNHLRDKGLVELKSKGDGRSKASIHRFCIEDSRYPKPRKEPRQYSDVDAIQEPRQCSDIVSTENHVIRDDKPRHGETETTSSEPGNHANRVTPLPKISSLESPPTPMAAGSDSKPKARTTQDYKEKLRAYFLENVGKPLPLPISEKAFLDRIPEKVWLSAKEYIASRNWNGLNQPHIFFDREFEGYYDPNIVDPEEIRAKENAAMIADREVARARVVAELEEKKRQKEAYVAMEGF